jgi:hypothetical protein
MGEIARQRQVAQKCAADAANYVHPKLANISHANDPDHSLIISDEERANAVLALQRRGRPALSIGHWTSRGDRNALGHRLEIQLWEVTGLRADYSGSREPRASVSRTSRTSSRKNRRSSMASFV